MNIDTYIGYLSLPTSLEAVTSGVWSVLFLLVAGITAITIARNYVISEGRGARYRFSVLLGVGFAFLLGIYCVIQYLYGSWPNPLIMLTAFLSFAMILRPVVNWNVAIAISLLVFLLVYYGIYIFVYGLVDVFGVAGVFTLSAALAVLSYMLLSYVQVGVQWVAGLLNAWPILGVLGGVCLVQGILTVLGYSLFGHL